MDTPSQWRSQNENGGWAQSCLTLDPVAASSSERHLEPPRTGSTAERHLVPPRAPDDIRCRPLLRVAHPAFAPRARRHHELPELVEVSREH